MNGNKAGNARANTVALKIVEKGSVTISGDTPAQATVLRKVAGAEIAQFTVKPSNSASEVDLDSIEFVLTGSAAFADFDEYDVTLSVGESDETITITTGDNYVKVKANPYVALPSAGLTVKVRAEKELTGTIELTGLMLNEKAGGRAYSKRFEDAVVRIVNQKDLGGATQFTVEVDGDSDAVVSALRVKLDEGSWVNIPELAGTFTDGATFELRGVASGAQYITSVIYKINNNDVDEITKAKFNDFFKVDGRYVAVFKS